jgi:hypothetical protein
VFLLRSTESGANFNDIDYPQQTRIIQFRVTSEKVRREPSPPKCRVFSLKSVPMSRNLIFDALVRVAPFLVPLFEPLYQGAMSEAEPDVGGVQNERNLDPMIILTNLATNAPRAH